MEIKSKNFCIVLSSPSGAGKTSISKKILTKDKSIALSISCTTRPRRVGERNKKDYYPMGEEVDTFPNSKFASYCPTI